MPKLYANLGEEQANLITLILSASGLPYAVVKGDGGWEIWIKEAYLEQANHRIAAYFQENSTAQPVPTNQPPKLFRTHSGLFSAALLLAIHAAIAYHHAQGTVFNMYSASAHQIMAGELYRAVTALMIHANPVHLVGNMIGIALFGTAVCTLTRPGMGWLLILLTGITGNLANAVFYRSAHVSIGASTAVFGAIGILCAARFWRNTAHTRRRLRTWLPLGAGFALLGFLGASGERTDLMAHLFGLLSGLVMGTGHSLMLQRPLADKYQSGCWVLTACILAGAWLR